MTGRHPRTNSQWFPTASRAGLMGHQQDLGHQVLRSTCSRGVGGGR